jgi:hypothetical protein
MEWRRHPRADVRYSHSRCALGRCVLHYQGGDKMIVLLGALLFCGALYLALAIVNFVERLASRDEHN